MYMEMSKVVESMDCTPKDENLVLWQVNLFGGVFLCVGVISFSHTNVDS